MSDSMTAKQHTTSPVGFRPGASLFKLSAQMDYSTQVISLSAAGAKPQTDQTRFVVLSPGATEIKLFAANDKGYCLSWLAIKAFPKTANYNDVFKTLGYTLEQ